jgi:hypothetical protein
MIEVLERLFVLVLLGALLLWLVKDIRQKLRDGNYDPNRALWLDFRLFDSLGLNFKKFPIVDRDKQPSDFWFTIIFRAIMASMVALFLLIYFYFAIIP